MSHQGTVKEKIKNMSRNLNIRVHLLEKTPKEIKNIIIASS